VSRIIRAAAAGKKMPLKVEPVESALPSAAI
jgi:hypothetical protein